MTARYKILAPTLLGSILLAACGASDDGTDSTPSGQASSQAASENSAQPALTEFPSRIDAMYAITRAFPGTGCSDRLRFSRNDRCTTGSGSITIDTRGEEVRDLMLLTTSISGAGSDLYRFLSAFGINDQSIMDWANEARQSTAEVERDAGAFRLSARRGRGEELRLIITDDGSASAVAAEREAIASSPVLMSVDAANRASTEVRLALLYFKFNPAALDSDTGAAYFAVLNNADRYASVASNEFDRSAYFSQLRSEAPAFLQQLDPTVTLSFRTRLGTYDVNVGAFPVGADNAFGESARRPFILDFAQGTMPPSRIPLPLPDFTSNELNFSQNMAIGTIVELDPAFRLETVPMPEDRARAFVEAQSGSVRMVTVDLDVEITSAHVPASAQRLAAHYTATPSAVRVSGAGADGELFHSEL